MVTQGLRIVVCQCRYFVYHIASDAYPSWGGKAIVSDVPTTDEAYAGRAPQPCSAPRLD